MNLREWPLVLFTLLFQAATGTATMFWAAGLATGPASPNPALAVFLPAAAAAGLSLFHLGRPGRALRSVGNLGRSWLSREIILLLAFNAAAAALVLDAFAALGAGRILWPIASFSGLAGVFAMSKIYMLPAVPDWSSGRTPAAFFSSAFVLGGPAAAIFCEKLETAAAVLLIGAYFLALLFAPRFGLFSRRPTPLGFRPNPAWPGVFLVRLALLAAAALLGIVSLEIAALAAATVSEIIGRFQFYDLPLGLSPRT